MVGLSVCYRKDSLSHLVTPNALIYFYFTLTFFLGSWGYSNEYVLVDKDLKVFTDWRYRQVSTCLSMLCTSLFLVVDIVYHKRYEVISSKINWSKHNGYFLFGTLFLVPFFFVSLNLDFIGAQGDLAILPKGIAAISVILYLSKLNKIKRYLGYGVLILFFATFSSDEKREAIFLIFPIIWLEANRYKIKPTLSTICSGVVIGVLAGVLILSMSVVRGYGNFGDVSSIFEAIFFLPQYINSDFFISAFLVNIEATYLYFHALNSIEMVLSDIDLLAYGSTLIKPLFIMFPREVIPFKPDSILELYTSAYDPVGRELGGSWTIGLFSEFIWNFYILGVFLVILVAKYLCKLNVSTTMKDYDKLGIVFNTDPHDKSGQHWFSVLVDFKGEYDKKTPCIFIYDSVGIQSELPPTIVELVNDISVQFSRLNDEPLDLIYNDIEHQMGNTECGVFCLYFLTQMLENNSLQDYLLLKPSDEDMKQYRNYFFIK